MFLRHLYVLQWRNWIPGEVSTSPIAYFFSSYTAFSKADEGKGFSMHNNVMNRCWCDLRCHDTMNNIKNFAISMKVKVVEEKVLHLKKIHHFGKSRLSVIWVTDNEKNCGNWLIEYLFLYYSDRDADWPKVHLFQEMSWQHPKYSGLMILTEKKSLFKLLLVKNFSYSTTSICQQLFLAVKWAFFSLKLWPLCESLVLNILGRKRQSIGGYLLSQETPNELSSFFLKVMHYFYSQYAIFACLSSFCPGAEPRKKLSLWHNDAQVK